MRLKTTVFLLLMFTSVLFYLAQGLVTALVFLLFPIPLLILIPNIALYWSVVLGALRLSNGLPETMQVTFSLASIALVSFGIPAWSNYVSSTKIERLTLDDRVSWPNANRSPPRIVELRSVLPKSNYFNGIKYPCDKVCQMILARKLATEVIISQQEKNGDKRGVSGYQIQLRDRCTEDVASGAIEVPEMVDLITRGSCIVRTDVESTRADLTISTEYSIEREESFSMGRNYAFRLEVIQNNNVNSLNPIFRKTTVIHSPIRSPLIIVPNYRPLSGSGASGSRGPGLDAWRHHSWRDHWWQYWRDKDDTVIEWLTRYRDGAFFHPVLSQTKPFAKVKANEIADGPRNLINQILERPGPQRFSTATMVALSRSVSGWLLKLRNERQLSSDDVRLLSKIISDLRIEDLSWMLHDLTKFSDQFRDSIPDLLNRMEVRVDQRQGHSHSAIGHFISTMQPETYGPYADQIVEIVHNEPDWPSSGLLRTLGQLGRPTAWLIRERLRAAGNSAVVQGAAVAACRADPPIASELLSDLENVFRQYASRNASYDATPILAKALLRHGRRQVLIDTRLLNNDRRLVDQLIAMGERFPISKCG